MSQVEGFGRKCAVWSFGRAEKRGIGSKVNCPLTACSGKQHRGAARITPRRELGGDVSCRPIIHSCFCNFKCVFVARQAMHVELSELSQLLLYRRNAQAM